MQVREIKLSAQKASKGKGQKEQVITRIVERFNSRSKKDLKDWRKSLDAAENLNRPNRVPYYNLCDEVEIDLHLTAVMQHGVVDKLLSEEHRIVDESGTIDKELTDFFHGQWFYDFSSLALEAEFKGHSLIQVGDIIEVNGRKTIQDIQLIPRRHVKPEYGEIVSDQNDERGYPYRNDDNMMYWLVEAGSNRDLGLFKKLAPIVLFKKNCMSAWSEYCEIFGMPTRVGKTNSRDKKDLDRMEESLQKAGKAAYAMLQDGESFEFIESTKGDAFNVYDKLIERCNSEISKAVVGSTLITDTAPNGNRSLGDVHLQSSDNIMETRKRLITAVVRDRLMPLLERRGLKTAGRIFEYSEKKDLNAIYTRTLGLLQYYDIEPQEIEDTLGIKVIAKAQPSSDTPPAPAPAKPEKKKLSNYSDARIRLSAYNDCTCCKKITLALTQKQTDELDKVTENLLQQVWNGHAPSFYAPWFQAQLAILREGFISGYKQGEGMKLSAQDFDFAIKYDSPNWNKINAMEANIIQFTAGKTLKMTRQLNEFAKQSKTFSEFRKQAEGITGAYNAAYLKTEYTQAKRVAAMAAIYYDLKSKTELYPYWKYITAGDSRVRESHLALDGKIAKHDSSFWNQFYPPNGWRCRCTVVPVTDAPTQEQAITEEEAIAALDDTNIDKQGRSEYDRMKQGGFNSNQAEQAVIYKRNTEYVESFPENGFGAKDMYGSKDYSWAAIQKLGMPQRPVNIHSSEEAVQYFNQLSGGKPEVILTDYNGRPIKMQSDLAIKKPVENRFELIDQVADILKNPDEVWYIGRDSVKGHTFNYIRFYKDEAIFIPVEFIRGGLTRVKSFFLIKNDTEREGYLIRGIKK